MALNPEVMRKAQTEIDLVVGNDRLPTLDDRQHLPYIDALTKEIHRWNVVAPLASSNGSMSRFTAPFN
ncbi:cytochrome c oxidase subunit 2 [Termitomyces sp. T159_Od127]|nr:cytochrome c oxidase subunit 2 [Termitomyces sp. T159_Od127]